MKEIRMYIYIIEGGWWHEGTNTEGVFLSKRKALEAANEIKKRRLYDYIDILKWEANGYCVETIAFYVKR